MYAPNRKLNMNLVIAKLYSLLMKPLLLFLILMTSIDCQSQMDSTRIYPTLFQPFSFNCDVTGKDTTIIILESECVSVKFRIRNGHIRKMTTTNHGIGVIWINKYNRNGLVWSRQKETWANECRDDAFL